MIPPARSLLEIQPYLQVRNLSIRFFHHRFGAPLNFNVVLEDADPEFFFLLRFLALFFSGEKGFKSCKAALNSEFGGFKKRLRDFHLAIRTSRIATHI